MNIFMCSNWGYRQKPLQTKAPLPKTDMADKSPFMNFTTRTKAPSWILQLGQKQLAFSFTCASVKCLAVTFQNRLQSKYINHPKSFKSLNLLKKHYFQWPKYKTRYAYDIYGNIAIKYKTRYAYDIYGNISIRLLCCPGATPVPESLT